MFQLVIQTKDATSEVLVGESYLNLSRHLPENRQIIMVTDAHLRKHYHEFLDKYPIIEIGIGEQNKTIDTLQYIYERLLHFNADRNSFIVAVGGGIVCDVAGFAASTYMRGVPFGFVSTTLLSQVDASVGGKNGINFGGYKNMIGTFNQPRFVLCDPQMLQTLPHKEFISGFAEIVKAAAIRDADFFTYLEQNAGRASERDPDVLLYLVTESVKIKAKFVEQDEKEEGERRILNFGHTFGHAIEILGGVSHGEAVSIGMMIAARWSAGECGFPCEQLDRLEQLLIRLGLPVVTQASVEEVFQGLVKDKKRENEFIYLVLLNEIGKTEIQKTSIETIKEKLPAYIR
ncbi:MAG: 3-dehydroquinate synthase [Bacteroidales bacterium]|jgi:3-dehydroquinate synthase|nr:3-dehydroquinate synthase [Bacteroidales bacterium]